MNHSKYFNHLLIWNTLFCVICIPTAGKLIDVFGIPLSISIFYFPCVYIFSDITTEVYGYAAARKMLWYMIGAQLVCTLIFQFVVYYPPSVTLTTNQAFVTVLSAAPRLVAFGTLATFIGDVVNDYILAKLKVYTNGRYLGFRFVTSTLFGQLVNTGVFYTFGLWGILPVADLIKSIFLGTGAKVFVEIVLLPLTLGVAKYLKKAEKIDFYDTDTDFNPFLF